MPEAERTVLWLRHTAINFLFVLILCSSVSPYGAEVIMPFPFLACFASSLGQGMLCALSVVQQGSCDHSVVYSPWHCGAKAYCPARWWAWQGERLCKKGKCHLQEHRQPGDKNGMCGDSCATASYSNGVGQRAGAVENRGRFLRTGGKGRIEGVSLLQRKEKFECVGFLYGTDDRQVGSLWVMTWHRWVKGVPCWEFAYRPPDGEKKQNEVFRKF